MRVLRTIVIIIGLLMTTSLAYGLTYSDNFDTDSVGQLPAGWVNIGAANWEVGTMNPVSSPNALVDTTQTDGDVVLFTAAEPSGDMTVTYDYVLNPFNGSNVLDGMGVVLRSDAANNNCYTFVMLPAANAGIQLILFAKQAGAYGLQIGNTTLYDSYTQGDIIHVNAHASGNTIQIKIWKNNEVEPTSYSLAVTNTQVTAAGYAGFYATENGATNSISIDNFNLTLPFTCSPIGLTSISLRDPNIVWSPYNWNMAAAKATTNNGGAYFRTGFTGTSLKVIFDTSALIAVSVEPDHYPIVRYSVDNGPLIDHQIDSVSSSCISVQDLASGTHTIEVYYNAGWWESGAPDMWNMPVEAVVVQGLYVDSGAISSPVTKLSKNLLWFGDSISQGEKVNYSNVNPANHSSYDTVPVYVAKALGAELGNVSFGAQGYEVTGTGNVPAWIDAYSYYYSGAGRLVSGRFHPVPDYVAIWHGTNGSVLASDVETAIKDIRTASKMTTKIFVIVPIGGFNRTPITTGFNNYVSTNKADTNLYLIDLGTSWQTGLTGPFGGPMSQQAVDSIHPDASWNARLGAAYMQAIQSNLRGRMDPDQQDNLRQANSCAGEQP